MSAPYTLILLRHGQSEWNKTNQFTGWVDVRLTEQGKAEAKRGGELLKESGLLPDVLHTSLLSRAIQTANIALDAADRLWIPVTRSWRLNERHYGALQGKDKAQTLEEFGQEQFMLWRRSFDVPPPPLPADDQYSQVGDPRYAGIDGEVPHTESLKLVIDRMLPYWESDIKPDLAAGKTVLVTAHGNSLRGLVKHLDGISDADIAELNIPTGIPLVYRLGDDFTPLGPGEYLDPEAAAAGAAAGPNPGTQYANPAPRNLPYGGFSDRNRAVREVSRMRGLCSGLVGAGDVLDVDLPVTGREIGDLLGDRDGVVAEALQVAAGEGGVDGRARLALPVLAEHLLEDGDMTVVETLLEVAQVVDEGEIELAQQLGERARDLDVELAHLGERALQALGDRALGEAHAGQLGDVLGDVSHALEGRADAQGGDDDAQVAGDGLLAGEDLDAQLVEGDRLLVDDVVGLDDLFGQRHVA